jgi:hypothetical protein
MCCLPLYLHIAILAIGLYATEIDYCASKRISWIIELVLICLAYI